MHCCGCNIIVHSVWDTIRCNDLVSLKLEFFGSYEVLWSGCCKVEFYGCGKVEQFGVRVLGMLCVEIVGILHIGLGVGTNTLYVHKLILC